MRSINREYSLFHWFLRGIILPTVTQTIAYQIGDRLYLSITDHCTLDCAFCPKTRGDFRVGEYDLSMHPRPGAVELVAAIGDPRRYAEVVEVSGRADLLPHLRAADLLLLPTEFREVSLVVLDALGHGFDLRQMTGRSHGCSRRGRPRRSRPTATRPPRTVAGSGSSEPRATATASRSTAR